MPPSHNYCKIDFCPPKYILLGSCTGPLGKVFFTYRSAHDLSEEDLSIYTNTGHVKVFFKNDQTQFPQTGTQWLLQCLKF